MEKELKNFVSNLSEKTGIEFSLYNKTGELLLGQDILKQLPEQLEEVFSDEKNLQTLFPIRYKGRKLIGCIDGIEKMQYNYAYLISELAENTYYKDSGLSKSEFFKSVLFGELSHSQIYKYMRKFTLLDLPSFTMLIGVEPDKMDDVSAILTSCCEDMDFTVTVDDGQIALVRFIKEEISEFQSPIEYAEFIKQTVYEETGVSCKISIGGAVKSILNVSSSFLQAVTTYRMQLAIGAKGDVHSYKEFLLIKMLEDLPKYKLTENLQTLMDAGAKEIFADEEMLSTAEEFLENSLNTSETSRKLYLHRNTLIYRLDKIERGTGLNIRKFSDAVTFRLITILSRLVK